jgi:lipopolysaccharide transport system permease protein
MSARHTQPGTLDRARPRHEGPRRIKVIRPPAFSPLALLHGVAGLSQYRDLLYTLTLHRIKVRYKQSLLGAAWAILQPLSLMLIYTFIFSLIARIPTDGAPYAVFVYTALLPWTYFSNALTTATTGLVGNSHLVTKVYFPREILPITYVLAALFDFAVASLVLGGLFVYYGVSLTFYALYALPIVVILTAFVTAVALALSALQVRFRDVGVAMPLLLQLWLFATPVVYPLSAVPERFQLLYKLNPMVGVIENFRATALHGAPPDFGLLGLSALVSFVLLPVAYVYFKHAEATVADII